MGKFSITFVPLNNQTLREKTEALQTLLSDDYVWIPYSPDQFFDCIILHKEARLDEITALSEQSKSILWISGYEKFQYPLPENVEIFPKSAPEHLIKNKIDRLKLVFTDNNALAVQTTTNAIMIFDADGRPIWANKGFTSLYGFSFDEFCQRFHTFQEASVLENPGEVIEKLGQNQEVQYQSWFINSENKKIWLQTSITPVFNGAGILDRFVVVETDITALKETEKELEQKTIDLEKQRFLFEEEKQRSDDLLHNILPKEVALKLKKGKVKPKQYKSVSIMFVDFKGFSKLCRTNDALTIVEELDYLIAAFDDIIGKHFLEKIKTIGDAYMCVGGLPMKNNSHQVNIILAALEIQQFLWEFNKPRILNSQYTWDCRIGIHTGEVIAGVVGKKKFAYDIWGDAVNVAARMEQSGVINAINISATTYELVKDYFDCIPRGHIEAKNIGQIEMYFVTGLKPEYATDSTGAFPNETFMDILRKM